MEPYRGFPEFMKTAELIQQQRPQTHFVIVGEDRVAYGKALPEGQSYKSKMLDALDLDMSRTHFTGLLPRKSYLEVLQASDLHVYLTVPFVLSWSMMESMSAGCAILASNTDPVREMVGDGVHGAMVNMKDPVGVAQQAIYLLDRPEIRHAMGDAARARIVEHYAQKNALPQKLALMESLVRS